MKPKLNRTHRYIAPMFFGDLINIKIENLFKKRDVVEVPRYYLHSGRKDVIVCVVTIKDIERFQEEIQEIRMQKPYVTDIFKSGNPPTSVVLFSIPEWIDINAFLKGKYTKISKRKIEKCWFPERFEREYRVAIRDPKLIAEIAEDLNVDPSIIGELDSIPAAEEEYYVSEHHQNIEQNVF
jgi:hypothetical protein